MKPKIKYFFSSLLKNLGGHRNFCPNCKADLSGSKLIDRKYVVTSLVECTKCNLLVRLPTDELGESDEFYQEEYSQGYTTDCPSEAELQVLIAKGFKGTERDYSRCIRFFEFLKIPKTARILDFGCSWGYGLYQMIQSGYTRAEGYEVSLPRGRYGIEKMSLPISSRPEDLSGTYDVVFSSHVLEHLPDYTLINELRSKINPGGHFIAVTPNGSMDFLSADFKAYHQLWGKVHPVLLTDRFLEKNFKQDLCYLDSWNSMSPVFTEGIKAKVLDKFELVFVLKSGE